MPSAVSLSAWGLILALPVVSFAKSPPSHSADSCQLQKKGSQVRCAQSLLELEQGDLAVKAQRGRNGFVVVRARATSEQSKAQSALYLWQPAKKRWRRFDDWTAAAEVGVSEWSPDGRKLALLIHHNWIIRILGKQELSKLLQGDSLWPGGVAAPRQVGEAELIIHSVRWRGNSSLVVSAESESARLNFLYSLTSGKWQEEGKSASRSFSKVSRRRAKMPACKLLEQKRLLACGKYQFRPREGEIIDSYQLGRLPFALVRTQRDAKASTSGAEPEMVAQYIWGMPQRKQVRLESESLSDPIHFRGPAWSANGKKLALLDMVTGLLLIFEDEDFRRVFSGGRLPGGIVPPMAIDGSAAILFRPQWQNNDSLYFGGFCGEMKSKMNYLLEQKVWKTRLYPLEEPE